nr:uncharacterized protein LOC129525998 [Gorilla gorilla gorilla]
MLPALEHQTPSSSAFGLLDLHQWFARGSGTFDHRLKAALLASLLLRFWDSDWLPGFSACRRPLVGPHLVIVCFYVLREVMVKSQKQAKPAAKKNSRQIPESNTVSSFRDEETDAQRNEAIALPREKPRI